MPRVSDVHVEYHRKRSPRNIQIHVDEIVSRENSGVKNVQPPALNDSVEMQYVNSGRRFSAAKDNPAFSKLHKVRGDMRTGSKPSHNIRSS